MGKLRQHKPVLSDALHPGTDVGNQAACRPYAEVEASQGAKAAGPWVLHVRDGVLPPWNWPKRRAEKMLMSSAPRPNARMWLVARGWKAPTCASSRYPTSALKNPQTTLTVEEESPLPRGLAKGLWKGRPIVPATK